MPEFTLPSGRVVETQEPLYGDEVHAIALGLNDPEVFLYAKFEAVVPGLSREEVAALSRRDGRALAQEVNRIFNGRPEEKEIPFGNSSPSALLENPPVTRRHSNGSSSTAGVNA